MLLFSLCYTEWCGGDDDDDVGLVNASSSSTLAAAATAAGGGGGVVRRTSLQCSPTSPSRSKPPPPVRRTSSITATSPMLRSPTADDRRPRPGELAPPAPASPSRARAAVVDGRSPSPRRAAAVRVTPAPRRSLSTAYADLCQTLNDQLAAGGGAGARRPGAWRSSAVDGATSPVATSPARGQPGCDEDGGTRCSHAADTLLRDIKRGVCLRPTVSNDRSAPTIYRT